MTQNPFEALTGGAGGLDLGGLLQQAQQMQADLEAAQQQIQNTTVEGTVAGGAVTVTLTGAGDLTGVSIAADAIAGLDAEALEDLGDLIVAAFRDARTKIEEVTEQTMGPITAGLPGFGGGPGDLGGAGQAPGQLGF